MELILMIIIVVLLGVNSYRDVINKTLQWSIETKDIQIEHRDKLIEMYKDQYGTIKQVIQSDTKQILKLLDENADLRKRLGV